MSTRHAIRWGSDDDAGVREGFAVQADRRIALFGSTMYVVMPKRHARPSSTMASVREEDSAYPRRENTRRQFRRGDCNFSRPALFLPPHFFPILFFPIHELQLTVERFWNARAFYGAAVPFITAGCSRIHTLDN